MRLFNADYDDYDMPDGNEEPLDEDPWGRHLAN
jgi:hypothetical protein